VNLMQPPDQKARAFAERPSLGGCGVDFFDLGH